MGKKVHIICATCGSDDVSFKASVLTNTDYDDRDRGISIHCANCGELTGLNEWNEFNQKPVMEGHLVVNHDALKKHLEESQNPTDDPDINWYVQDLVKQLYHEELLVEE